MTNTDQQRNLVAQVVARAWSDRAFRAALIADPRAVLQAAEVDVPAGQRVTVIEDTEAHRHFAIPADLTDDVRQQLLVLLTSALPLPAGTDVTLHQNSAEERYLVLPVPLGENDPLPEDALDLVVGGLGGDGGGGGLILGGGNGGAGGIGLLLGNGGVGWIG